MCYSAGPPVIALHNSQVLQSNITVQDVHDVLNALQCRPDVLGGRRPLVVPGHYGCNAANVSRTREVLQGLEGSEHKT